MASSGTATPTTTSTVYTWSRSAAERASLVDDLMSRVARTVLGLEGAFFLECVGAGLHSSQRRWQLLQPTTRKAELCAHCRCQGADIQRNTHSGGPNRIGSAMLGSTGGQ